MYNFDESTVWRPCFFVDNIELPTGYYLGFTAVTGELAGIANSYAFYNKHF